MEDKIKKIIIYKEMTEGFRKEIEITKNIILDIWNIKRFIKEYEKQTIFPEFSDYQCREV